jgi:outer membrane protein assembly factor BamB
MWRIGRGWGKRRSTRLLLGIGALGLLVAGAVFAFTQRDRERYDSDPERMAKLAATSLPLPGGGTGQADWPQWRGPNRDGLSAETGLLTDWPAGGPRVLWKRVIGRGFSSVAVANGRLYTMEEETAPETPKAAAPRHREAVLCLDARTGREVWRFRYPNEFDERFGSGPRSTPAVDGNFVYAVGPKGIFHCLRADTGEKVWRHDLLREFRGRPAKYGVSFSPLVEGNLVYATPGGPDGNAVVAFEKHTGKVAWKALDDPMGYSSPIVVTAAGVRQLLCLTNTALVSLSPEDGKLYWRYPWETDNGFNIATPIGLGNYVFISSAYDKGCALVEIAAEADGSLRPHRVYEHNRMRNYFSSSVRYGEHIYGFDQKDLVCMQVRTGRVVWREKGVRTFGKGSLLIADGHLLVLGELGMLALAEAAPAGYRQKAAVRVSENKCWTVPALAGGNLYIRNEGEILCLSLKKK